MDVHHARTLSDSSQTCFVFTYGTLRVDAQPKNNKPPFMGTEVPPDFSSTLYSTEPLNGLVVNKYALLVGYLLFDTGLGYPVAVRDYTYGNITTSTTVNCSTVVGTLWKFPEVNIETVLVALDYYEGVGRLPYYRELAQVKTFKNSNPGTEVFYNAWVYVYSERPPQGERIAGGDWVARVR